MEMGRKYVEISAGEVEEDGGVEVSVIDDNVEAADDEDNGE